MGICSHQGALDKGQGHWEPLFEKLPESPQPQSKDAKCLVEASVPLLKIPLSFDVVLFLEAS